MGYFKKINECGKVISVPISKEIYDYYLEEKNETESRIRKKKRNKIIFVDNINIDDIRVDQFQNDKTYAAEKLKKAFEVIENCTITQQRRFKMYRILGYSIAEISVIENCSEQAISNSIDKVKQKLLKIKM